MTSSGMVTSRPKMVIAEIFMLDLTVKTVICSLETNMRTEVDWRHKNRLETKIVYSNQ